MLLAASPASAQIHSGILKGKIIDGVTHQTIYRVAVTADSSSAGDTSTADGRYRLMLSAGTHTLSFQREGFRTKVIKNVGIFSEDINELNIILYPEDSVVRNDAAIPGENISSRLSGQNIQPGTDQDGTHVLKRLNGVIVENKGGALPFSSFIIHGLGERYNNFLLNGAPVTSLQRTGRSWSPDIIPVEAIEEASVQTIGDPSIPGDFAGGTVAIRTKDMPEQNFFYARAGAGLSDGAGGKDFYLDSRGSWEALSFPGNKRAIPSGFPTTRSQYSLDQLNLQEKVFQLKLLKNNLGPLNHGAPRPDDKVVLGFGRIIRLKKGEKIGILAYLDHQGTERIEESTVQAAPDITNNPYPFPEANKPLIRSLSNNISYRSDARLGATLNASMLFGKNKISFRNFFSNRFINTYTRRSQLFKPDEDTLAHTGVNYLAEQTTILSTQLSGEHAYGENGKFKMDWLAAFAYYHRQDPDERNFLLRQDSTTGTAFEIAHPQVSFSPTAVASIDPAYTNSGRQWTDAKDYNFNGAVNMVVPFNLLSRSQILAGGIGIQTRYRVLYSDFLLMSGPGYYSLYELLAPERYYPGGLTAINYFANGKSPLAGGNSAYIDATNRGNYVGSSNMGTAYIRLENHIIDGLSLTWGLRLESNSQLVSNIRYAYYSGFKNPQKVPIDENTRIIRTDLLPSVMLAYQPLNWLHLQTSWFRSLNRPELQELTPYRHYDPLSFMVTTGNPILNTTLIDNYDARIAFLARKGTRVSVSGFYKKIDQPIAYIVTGYAGSKGNLLSTPYNMPSTDVRGLAADININIGSLYATPSWLDWFSVFAHGTWLNSTVSGGPIRNLEKQGEHTLPGSPDYTVNAGVVLQHPSLAMITVLYSRTGDYLAASGSGNRFKVANGTVLAIPDYRIKERDELDLQISQKFWRSRIQVIAGVNNLTNSEFIEYQDLDGNKKFNAPLTLAMPNNDGGYFKSGVDNTVLRIKPQRTYYLTVSYLFR
jgi:hypothetical protein